MSFYRNKVVWAFFIVLSPFLYIAARYGVQSMTSVYQTDFGNGVVIYADEYVNSEKWVFDCRFSRLISRKPLAAPVDALQRAESMTIEDMPGSADEERRVAKEVIRSVTAIPEWYLRMKYVYSSLSDDSEIDGHLFDLIALHQGQKWAVRVRQRIGYSGDSSFKIRAQPYDPETYVDYAKALEAAYGSCEKPQSP
ncbi:hypothetical protein HNP46_003258 [Pseudomonas nitritireducens]|uniref:Uncharacterized protein n=1 Tax=Pseudomonas nitroreducens TaxID=46680 RepID=A0A7W7P244_PSENT|nr:hypothetical protein [Pseudomonas nitritireducens]MBB4864394.1 hypothetical protein [Pseudomonas nitritireducens]